MLRSKTGNALTGTLKFHPKGHAFFFPDVTDETNLASGLDLVALSRVHIPRRDTGTALEGDRVLVSLQRPAAKRASRTRMARVADASEEVRGKVEKILDRRSGRLVGVFRKKGNFGWIECADKAVDGLIDLIGDTTAQPGQLVVVALENWNDATTTPRGRILEVLGWPGDPGVEILSVIHRFGLRTSFPEDVLAEARGVSEAPTPAEIARRSDWRDKLVITIDPADAKDHDDAVWLEKTRDGWTLAVHIADVSHYIKPGSAMDREAIARGNSTYLVDRVLPMLPEKLSNNLCSLRPRQDRLTVSCFIEFGPKLEPRQVTFGRSVIHSKHRLTYKEAFARLESKDTD